MGLSRSNRLAGRHGLLAVSPPIGPVTRHGGWQEDPPYAEYPRYVWKPSPDTEEVRQHLLSLLDSIFEHMLDDEYPLGNRLGAMVVWQLGEFREQRAVERLTELSEDRLGRLVEAASEALAKIRGGDSGTETELNEDHVI